MTIKNDAIVRRNLFIMTIVWLTTSNTFYIFNFRVTKLQGNLFHNNLASSLADSAVYFVTYLVLPKIGLKKSICIS